MSATISASEWVRGAVSSRGYSQPARENPQWSSPAVPSEAGCFQSQQVAAAIERELGVRVRGLKVRTVRESDMRIVRVTGSIGTYHQKQLASRAAMEALQGRDGVLLQNDLCVR